MAARAALDLAAAVTLALTALLGAYLPVWLARSDTQLAARSLMIALGNMLSAGVMVSAGFVGLLGRSAQELAHTSEYPMGAFLAALGFMLTLAADQAADGCSAGHVRGDYSLALPVADHYGGGVDPSTQPWRRPTTTAAIRVPGAPGEAAGLDEFGNAAQFLGDLQPGSPTGVGNTTATPLDSPGTVLSADSQVSPLSAGLMTVALSFHSLLEGVALGAGQDTAHSVQIFIAIQAHKGLTAFALGSSLVQSAATPRRFWAMVLAMAASTPLGILVGLLLSGLTSSAGAAGLQALAAGTFIHVALVEILPNELAERGHNIPKLCAMGLGFGLMSLLEVWA